MHVSGKVWCLVMLGLSAWSEGAPQGGQEQQQSSSAPSLSLSHSSTNDIIPSIPGALARRKRASAGSSRPYSNYRPLRTMGRYRYPVYRKRSFTQVPAYDYDYEGNYLPDQVDDLQQDRHEQKFLSSPYVAPLVKKDSLFNIAHSPYDLQTMGRLYEVGKRNNPIPLDVYDLKTLGHVYEVGKRSPPVPPNPSYSTREFYNAIDAVRRKKSILETTEHSSAEDPMIRRKRDMAFEQVGPPSKVATGKNSDTNATADSVTNKNDTPNSLPNGHNGSSVRQKKSAKDDNLNEFLTRKYFQTFAQSVGDKKKRMAYAQFTADKRSPGVEEMLSNPTMLQYMQDQLKGIVHSR